LWKFLQLNYKVKMHKCAVDRESCISVVRDLDR
jgi:hypothetical protein